MQLVAQSEWMTQQKQAVVLSPEKEFQVVQTPNGQSVFFSIGTNGTFYVTREVHESHTGWVRVELSKKMTENHPTEKIVAKSFAVAQSSKDMSICIALIVKAGHSDYLYMSESIDNDDKTWQQADKWDAVQWSQIPFDGEGGTPDGLQIADVHFTLLPSEDGEVQQTCFVDVLKQEHANNELNLINRYFVETESNPRWRPHFLSVDMSAKGLLSCLGQRPLDYIGGMYSFGRIGSSIQLVYRPAYNVYDEMIDPNPVRLQAPIGSTAIASAFNAEGMSSVFISSTEGISIFAVGNQGNDAVSTKILGGNLVSEARQLSAITQRDITALFGVSSAGNLFYTTCPVGSETVPEKWSPPIALVADIYRYSFFVSATARNNTVFAQSGGNTVIQLTQDPVTFQWKSREILLPTTDIDDYVNFGCFATRLMLETDNEEGVDSKVVELTATSPIGVYVDEKYYVLSPRVPIRALTDQNGAIKIMQPAQKSSSVCYKARAASNPNVSLEIDPSNRVKAKLNQINSLEDLENARVPLSDGTTTPLIPSDISKRDRQAFLKVLKQMNEVRDSLPQDGSVTQSKVASTYAQVSDFEVTLFRLKPQNGGGFSEFDDEVMDIAVSRPSKPIWLRAGDLFQSLEEVWHEITEFAVNLLDGVYSVLVKIGGAIYEAILDTVAAVNSAIEWLFKQINVGMHKLKDWLGFVFGWNDILRTHRVIKNVIAKYASHGLDQIGDLKKMVESSLTSLEKQIAKWADLPFEDKKRIKDKQKSSNEKNPSQNDPQTNFIQDKLVNHFSGGKVGFKFPKSGGKNGKKKKGTGSGSKNGGKDGDKGSDEKGKGEDGSGSGDKKKGSAGKAMDKLKEVAQQFGQDAIDVVEEIRVQIIEQFATLTLNEVCKRLGAIIANLVIETAKNFIVGALDIITDIGSAVLKALDTEIDIPVLTPMYKWLTDEKMSILSLIALAAAVPITLLYKALVGKVPFPDDATSTSLIEAKDFKAVQAIVQKDKNLVKTFAMVAEYAAMSGLLIEIVCTGTKAPQFAAGTPEAVSDTIKQVSIPVKLLITMPKYMRPRSDTDPWYRKMDAWVTDIAVLKCLCDATDIGAMAIYGKVSPYIDFAISASWTVTAVFEAVQAFDGKDSSISRLASDLAYSVALLTAPIIWAPGMEPTTKLAFILGGQLVIMLSSPVRVGTAAMLYEENMAPASLNDFILDASAVDVYSINGFSHDGYAMNEFSHDEYALNGF